MQRYLAYPRLNNVEALALLHDIREQAQRDPEGLNRLSAVSHPRAEAVPTGATTASEEAIAQVRDSVIDVMQTWMTGHPVRRDATIAFDLALGKSLHRALNILPADAAHDETWSFLSVVVFPDVVWTRFPDLHPNRVLGKRHRNTLRRAWFRYDVIGDLQEGAAQPLGEDEMTGIFERSQVARDRELVRTVTTIILNSDVRNRSEYVRNLMKGVTALTGTYLLDGLTTEELQERLESLTEAPRVRAGHGPRSSPAGDPAHRTGNEDPATTGRAHRVSGHDRTDLVRRFHLETLNLCTSVEKSLGRPPSGLLRMIDQMGGVDAVRSVVGAQSPSETFSLLWAQGRLDLTLEALVLKEDFQGLFSEGLRSQAASRLAQVGYEAET